MNRFGKIGIACLLLLVFLAQGCSAIGIGKKKPPNITVKVIAEPLERFTSFEPLLREKFPHMTFEAIDPIKEVGENVNISPQDQLEAVIALVEDTDADLFLNLSPDAYIEEYPLLDLAPLLNVYGIELNNHQKILADQATRPDGTLTELSPTFNKRVLFINGKLLRELNVDEPESPMTWEAFRQAVSSVKEQYPEVKSYMANLPQFSGLVWVGRTIMGWNVVEDNQLTLDRPEWRQLYEQLYEDGMKESFLENKIYSPRTFDNTGLFISGADYIRSLINGGLSPEDWSIVELPRDPMNQYRMPIWATNPFAVHAESEYIDELMQVMAYLMSEEAAARIDAEVIGGIGAKGFGATQNPYGFVTYPDAVSFSPFSADVIFETNGAAPPLSTVTFTGEAYWQLSNVFAEQFEAVAKGTITFDQGWERVETAIQEINSDPNNFTAAD
ncbi:extracellular solute-binding protein [Paenibacillus sp. NPDC057967]|uniref:extracellular solute-binding protein n=1 Tax=Paenibacillus sp. NPDC057967 TaxID=3346293 RepID=UPI0036DE6B5E